MKHILFIEQSHDNPQIKCRAQNNRRSKDNIWPELQLALPKTSVTTGHIDWSRMHSTLVQEKTAKSSPVNLKFCFFEKNTIVFTK